jgi:hypothetical protein
MEGMFRQVSEFELASYKKNPEKFYAGLLGSYDLESFGELNAKFLEIQQSAGSKNPAARVIWIRTSS